MTLPSLHGSPRAPSIGQARRVARIARRALMRTPHARSLPRANRAQVDGGRRTPCAHRRRHNGRRGNHVSRAAPSHADRAALRIRSRVFERRARGRDRATIAGMLSDQRGARRAAGYGFRRFGGFERAGGTVFCESECSHSCERAFGSTFGTGSHEWETSKQAPAPSSAPRDLPIVKGCPCAPAKPSRTHVSVPPEPPIRTKPSRPGEAPCSGCSRSHAPVPTRRLAPARAPRARARKRGEPGHPPSRLAPQSADPTLAHGSRGVRRALAPSRLRAARRAPTRRCRPSP